MFFPELTQHQDFVAYLIIIPIWKQMPGKTANNKILLLNRFVETKSVAIDTI